jgi:hypothetical protein
MNDIGTEELAHLEIIVVLIVVGRNNWYFYALTLLTLSDMIE